MLLTTKQVAELLQVSERQVRDLVNSRLRNGDPRSNPMPVCRLGERVLRFDREDVLAWAKIPRKE
jgi:predicted DNA-binding transcriptional regulator AlpA